MSQRCVEILLGKLMTDETFRRSFFPVQADSFVLAAADGLEFTQVERGALMTLLPWRFDLIAQGLDPRLSRSPIDRPADGCGAGGNRDSS